MLPHQLREIAAQLSRSVKSNSDNWFQERGIDIHNKDMFWILDQKTQANKNPWNSICNGLVYTKEQFLISVPPTKFYNFSDQNAVINLHDSDLLQKVDGEMFVAIFPWSNHEHPCIHTRTKISYVTGDMGEGTPLYAGRKAIRERTYKKSDTDYGYTFQYDGRDLFLVAGRHIGSLFEHSEEELDSIAKRLGCMRPLRYPCQKGWLTVERILKEFDESFFVRDRNTGDRAHVMLPIAIKRPKLLISGKYKYLLPYWLNGEYKSLLNSYPLFRERYAVVDDTLLKIKTRMKKAAEHWCRSLSAPNKAAIAAALNESQEPYWAKRIILRLVDIHQERWDESITEYFRRLTPKALIEIMGLID